MFGELFPISQIGHHQGWPIMNVKEKASKSNEKELVSDYTKLVLAEYNFKGLTFPYRIKLCPSCSQKLCL